MKTTGLGFTKPPPGSDINWGHPMARNMAGCFIMNEGQGNTLNNLANLNYSVVTQRTTTAGPQGYWTSSNIGPAIYFKGNQDSFSNYSNPITRKSEDITYAALVNPSSISQFGIIVANGFDGNTNNIELAMGSSGSIPVAGNVFKALYNTWQDSTFTFQDVNIWYSLVFTHKDGIGYFYVNGQSQGKVTCANPGPINNYFTIGDSFTNVGTYNQRKWTGLISYIYIWDRAISKDEVMWLYNEPYSFVNPPSGIRYYVPAPPAAGPGGGMNWPVMQFGDFSQMSVY